MIISLERAVSSFVIGKADITHHTPSISLVQDGIAVTREGEAVIAWNISLRTAKPLGG